MTSVSQMKALKRSRAYVVADEGCRYESHVELSSLPPGPHAPAKPESHLLRRLCAQTGLTEQQVREHKTYRRLRAQASKPPTAKPLGWRNAMAVRKAVTASTGLHPLHPDFFAAFDAAWFTYTSRFALRRRNINVLREMSGRDALQLYLLKAQPTGKVAAHED